MSPQLRTELWTSWASLLRSYAAAHGLNAAQAAVVEVGAGVITVRYAARWMEFSVEGVRWSDGAAARFALCEDGTVLVGDAAAEEMDFAAERLVRELMDGA